MFNCGIVSRLCSRSTCTHIAHWSTSFSVSYRQRSEADFEAARKWYREIKGSPVSREIGEISYSRSSGPGGQNVNKVNSKAQLRVSMNDLLPLLPTVLHGGIRNSRFYADKTSTLLIQSDESRKQTANKDACYKRLDELVLQIYNHVVPGETSDDQKDKVKRLKRAENEARLRLKKRISSKKASRKSGYE